MERPRGIRRLLRLPAGRRPIEREIDDELAFHFDQTMAELVARGMLPDDARREAVRRFGSLPDVKRALQAIDGRQERDERRQDRLAALAHDLRYAARSLIKDHRVALAVVVTLALGIGANATMFGIVDRLLLRPPPHVADDPQLASVYIRRESRDFGAFYNRNTSYPGFAALRDEEAFSDVAAHWDMSASLGRGVDAVKINVALVTANFFPMLGVKAAQGRFFLPDEDRRGESKAPAVISHGLWTRQFGSATDIVGREIQINQGFYTIVGVAPVGFNGPQLTRTDAWVPMHAAAPEYIGPNFETHKDMRWLEILARRRADVSGEAAAAMATATYRHVMRELSKDDSTARIVLASMIPARGVEGLGGVLTGATGSGNAAARVAAWLSIVAAIVLAIACANVANLLLLRTAGRRREVAVRLALGISRGRLAAQLIMESVILAALGGAAAIALVPAVTRLLRGTLLGAAEVAAGQLDMRLLLFTAGCVSLVGVAAGLAPLFLSRRLDLSDALKAGVRDGSVRRSRLRSTLIVMQGALSMLLLVGAGLFVRSLHNVSRLDLGFDPDRVMVATVDVSGVVSGREAFQEFWQRAQERVAALPTVASAAQSVTTPLESGWTLDVDVPGRAKLPPIENGPYLNAVSPGYFTTMGMRIVRGRAFTTADRSGAASVAIISEGMARYLWPGQDALGRCYHIVNSAADGTLERTPCLTVVGVAQNTRANDFRESAPIEQYVPLAQSPAELEWRVLIIRASDDASPARAALDVRRTLQSLSPNLPFADVRFLREPVSRHTRPWELGATMFALFGILALLIASMGLYSTIAYDMTQRTHEFGVRQALGASRGDVGRLVLGRALRYAAPGLVLGTGLALIGTRWVGPLLFEVSPRDPLVFALVGLTLLAAAVSAALGPARRAQRLDPVAALRDE